MCDVLITGASGFLGAHLYKHFARETAVCGTYFEHAAPGLIQLDVRDQRAVSTLVERLRPRMVIHTIAASDPDYCEAHQQEAEAINYHGAAHISEATASVGAQLVYISTIYVFDGRAGHYRETDAPNPINWYGQTKMRAERVISQLPRSIILRFDLLYGFNGFNFANGFFGKILRGQPFDVNADQTRQPLYVGDVGSTLQLLIASGHAGSVHLAGPESLTKYALGLRMAALVGKQSCLLPTPEREQLARRPADASLDVTLAHSLGIRFTPLEDALEIMRAQLSRP